MAAALFPNQSGAQPRLKRKGKKEKEKEKGERVLICPLPPYACPKQSDGLHTHTSRSVDYFPSHSHAPALTPTIFPDRQIGFFCVCSSVDLDAQMTVLDVAIWL